MSSPYRGHDPDTPPGAEAALESFQEALGDARHELARLRDAEVEAKAARDSAKRRARFSPDCPKVGVVDGVRTTVAFQEAWIEEQVADEELRYELAKSARRAAADHLHTLGKQGGFQQSIAASVRTSYAGQWGGQR